MQQYLGLLQAIKERGTVKPPAREGMPGSLSLFGYQFRHNLQEGFPLLTTKKMYWKGIVTELLWFLRGDTNIKYLLDNGSSFWNEDAYNFYLKQRLPYHLSFEDFIREIKDGNLDIGEENYRLGDCGFQYGKVWRNWETVAKPEEEGCVGKPIDQISNLINGLKKTPESRRHIVTAIDPAHNTDLALYWCHAMFQFNCRPMTFEQRMDWVRQTNKDWIISENKQIKEGTTWEDLTDITLIKDDVTHELHFSKAPKYYLDCQLYQRSADVFLGVPFNIASYALLTNILAKMCNMVPGDYIHTFGDVHIYENHLEQVNEQLTRTPFPLSELKINWAINVDFGLVMNGHLDDFIQSLKPEMFVLENYQNHPSIKATLSTGLIK